MGAWIVGYALRDEMHRAGPRANLCGGGALTCIFDFDGTQRLAERLQENDHVSPDDLPGRALRHTRHAGNTLLRRSLCTTDFFTSGQRR